MINAPQKSDNTVYAGKPAILIAQKTLNNGTEVPGSFNIGKNPGKPIAAENIFKQAYRMILHRNGISPLLKKRTHIVQPRIRPVQMHKGRLYQADGIRNMAGYVHRNPSLGLNEGQLLPAARNTSSEGIRRDFIEKISQELGSHGSQVTLK
jgi:hypothetical protein